ncbi:MAG: phosphate regulon transcriptional regulatory protein PhoB [Rhodocyclaceae bacterium]|nr:MAG: phosphate regulon transcriptional regulatory protein PhoB [Rhodocyclaceae bacterium]
MMTRVLVVEDETAIQELLTVTLATAGFEVEVAGSAEEALQSINKELPELILIDWMLPGMSGLQLAQQLRSHPRTSELPLIMLTARGNEGDRVAGLDTGADDYITKPFSPRELVARVRAVLRRRMPQHAGDIVVVSGVRLDPTTLSVTIDGNECAINPTEFKLLRLLLSQPGRVFNRNQLLDLVWGDHRYVEERTVDVSIRRLRVAMGPRGDDLIETVRGVGYRFVRKDG